jgi:hypothetical protein
MLKYMLEVLKIKFITHPPLRNTWFYFLCFDSDFKGIFSREPHFFTN